MAYPFVKGVPYRDFIRRLQALGAMTETLDVKIDGQTHQIVHLVRIAGDDTWYSSLSFANDGDFVEGTVIRSVCCNLGIHPAAFGLHLG